MLQGDISEYGLSFYLPHSKDQYFLVRNNLRTKKGEYVYVCYVKRENNCGLCEKRENMRVCVVLIEE